MNEDAAEMFEGPVVEIKGVTVEFDSPGGIIRAMDDVSLTVEQGETVAVVGESGCGKTTLARAVLGLQKTVGGEIVVKGEAVTGVTKGIAERIGMVWQDPYASLDPRWEVGKSANEPAALTKRKIDLDPLFREVGLDPSMRSRYPHQLSGGQRQRVAIARAIALRPPLLICDEPTAALDLSIRAQILNLLRQIQGQVRCSILYISHDLMTVRFLADRIAVMYLGRIVEEGPTEEVFTNPRHPYTKALLDSAPTLEKLRQLPEALPGELPDPRERFAGCRFAARCVHAQESCLVDDPGVTEEGQRKFRCHFPIAN
ncbi:MAG: ABC transporter ATP-binding protein [Fimbriimonadaceae bacterium]|nr:ABC transporter ATP-binding protein [Fimbriimonadaceae bacterium]